ncbi:MAG: hypothetical protein K1X57_10850 [Gemmataceae bacterium]|nr:hypothetical protein [Gemmataceae bacterium]
MDPINVYWLIPAVDNPLFEGLATERDAPRLNNWPADWCRHYSTWESPRLSDTWQPIPVIGRVRLFNDFPCINMLSPALSQRAVDLLRDLLEPNGELLPVTHSIGTYYFFNCTRVLSCLDLDKSAASRTREGIVTRKERLVFLNEVVRGETVFRIRTQPPDLFCTQTFADRVAAASLQGFVFVKVWPLSNGTTFFDELHQATKRARKWQPLGESSVDIKQNTVLLRMFCSRKKPTAADTAAATAIMDMLDEKLASATSPASGYVGTLEGHDVLGREIRLFLSSPDCDRLVAFLLPFFRTLPWPGRFQVVKHRGDLSDGSAPAEYVTID